MRWGSPFKSPDRKLVRQLPEAYRSHTTSFIVILCQGIHHTPLNFLIGNLRTTYKLYFSENIFTLYSIYPSSASKRPQWSKMRIKPSNILLKMRKMWVIFQKKLVLFKEKTARLGGTDTSKQRCLPASL